MTTKEMMKEVRELGNTPKDLGPNEETGISKAAAKFVKYNGLYEHFDSYGVKPDGELK